jgi:hypothetical protein
MAAWAGLAREMEMKRGREEDYDPQIIMLSSRSSSKAFYSTTIDAWGSSFSEHSAEHMELSLRS